MSRLPHHRRQNAYLLCLLLCLAFVPHQATSQITYANSQTNGVTGLCLLCTVADPNNPVDSNYNNYAQFNITAGFLGVSVYQTLIFPTVSTAGCDSLIIGIGSANNPLSVNIFGGITVQTYNGATANNDATGVTVSNFRTTTTGRGEIFLKPGAAFDRVQVRLSSSLVGLLVSFRLYYGLRASTAPPAPTVTVPGQPICAGSSALLTATSGAAAIDWYDALSGGTLLHSGSTFTVTPPVTTTYYAQASLGGCTSTRTPATVTVKPVTATPTIAADTVTITLGDTATLTATSGSAGSLYQWFATSSGGTPVFTGNPLRVGPDSTTTYYLQQTDSGACTSVRIPVTVVVNIPPPCGLAPANPFAWYPLNGNANDSTPHARNGAGTGVSYSTEAVCKQALVFDHENAYVRFPDSTTLPTTGFTVAFWAKHKPLPPPPHLIGRGTIAQGHFDSNQGWNIDGFYESFGAGYFADIRTTGGSVFLNAVNPQYLNRWNHVVVTYDGAFANLYINGSLAQRKPLTGVINYTHPTFYGLGDDAMANRTFYGRVDEFYIYDHAIDSAAVRTFYQSYGTGFSARKATPQPQMTQAASEVQQGSLRLYPNPTHGVVHFHGLRGVKGTRAFVKNQQGSIVLRATISNNSLDLSSLAPGVYFIQLTHGDNKMTTHKILLTR